MPAIQANARYEGKYPLVSALSRPVIVRHLVAAARRHGADAVAHGCTGKGNDQVRFEVGTRSLAPDLEVLAPARVWGLTAEQCVDYAAKWDIPIAVTKEKLYSIDENLWGRAIECGAIEDPWADRPDRRVHPDPARRPPSRSRWSSASRPGVPVSLDGRALAGRRAHRRGGPPGRLDRLRAARHGREPPGRHQEPGGLRVPGRPGPADGPRRPRGPHPRAGPAPREGPPRAPLGRAGLRRDVVLAAQAGARRLHRRVPAPRDRRGAAALRTAGRRAPWPAGAARWPSTTTAWPPTTPSDTFRHQDAEGFVRLWGLGVATWAARQGRAGRRQDEGGAEP